MIGRLRRSLYVGRITEYLLLPLLFLLFFAIMVIDKGVSPKDVVESGNQRLGERSVEKLDIVSSCPARRGSLNPWLATPELVPATVTKLVAT